MLSLDSIQESHISVLVQLLKQIKSTENSFDTTVILEEIFSLLPQDIQTELVSSNDISKSLNELYDNLNMKILFGGEPALNENTFKKGIESPSSLKRKLSRAETIILNLEANLEELKTQNALLNRELKDSQVKEKSAIAKAEKDYLELQHSLVKITNCNMKILRIRSRIKKEKSGDFGDSRKFEEENSKSQRGEFRVREKFY